MTRSMRAMRTRILSQGYPYRWAICSMLILGCAILGFWMAVSTHAQSQPDPTASIDAILLIDSSGSMQTTDPDQLRIRATQFLLDYLQTYANAQRANYRIGLANFGGRVGDTFNLQLLQDNTIRNGLRVENIKGTEFVPPLQYAANELRQKSDPQTRKVVVLLTDGQPGPEGNVLQGEDLQHYFDATLSPVVQELKGMGADIFVLAIGDAQQDRKRWESLIGDHYIPVAKTTDLNSIFHQLFSNAMGLTSVLGRSQPSNSSHIVQIGPLLEHLTFSFLKSDPAISVTLTDPRGVVIPSPVEGNSGNYHQIYSIPNPLEGDWHIQYQGAGSVVYWYDWRSSQVTVHLESAFPYSGQPINITAQLVRSGVIVTQTQNLHLEADLVAPGSRTSTLALTANPTGAYTGVFTNTLSSGTYTVTTIRVFMPNGPNISVLLTPASIVLLPAPLPPTSVPATEIATTEVVPAVTPTVLPPPEHDSGLPLWLLPILVVTIIAVAVLVVFWQAKSEHLQAEIKKIIEDGDRKRRDAVKFTGSNPDKASSMFIEVISSAINSVETTKEPFIQLIGDTLDGLSKVGEQYLKSSNGSLNLDDNKVIALKIMASQNAQKSGNVVASITSDLNRILRKSSSDREIAEKNLKFIANNPVLLLNQLREFRHDRVHVPEIQTLGEIAERLHSLIIVNEDENQAKQPILLKEVAKYFRETYIKYADLQEQDNHSMHKRHDTEPDVVRYYDYLANLSEFPLHPIECPPLEPDFWVSVQMDPTQSLDVKQKFCATFQLNSPLDEEAIKRIEIFSSFVEVLHEPDRSSIRMICARWKEEIARRINAPGEDRVRLSLSPELTLLHKTSENIIPFLIENLGSQPIWNIRLIITSNSKYNEILPPQQERPGYKYERIANTEKHEITTSPFGEYSYRDQEQGPFLWPGQYIIVEVQQKILEAGSINPELQYDNYMEMGKIIKLDIGTCSLVMREQPWTEIVAKSRVFNPFNIKKNRELPPDYLMSFADVPSRKKIREEIQQIIDSANNDETGTWINIYGPPRVGKTTLLHQIRQKLEDQRNRYIPVRVSFETVEKSEDISKIFKSISDDINYTQKTLYSESPLSWDGNTGSPLVDFEQFITKIYHSLDLQEGRRTFVLLIDNLKKFKGDHSVNKYKDLLINLVKLAEKNRIVLVLATEDLLDVPSNRHKTQMSFFNKEDLRVITQQAKGIQFSGLSLEYLYRFTGGYPDAIHRICHHIFRNRATAKMGGVNLPLVSEVIVSVFGEWIHGTEFDTLGTYITKDGMKMLDELAYNSRIDFKSLRIISKANNMEKDLLFLSQKDILFDEGEQNQDVHIYTMRVGFMALLVKQRQ